MSTRSSIAVQLADGTIQAVYCHFDGYLDGVGMALQAEHNSQEMAAGLVALGDLSTVCREVEAYARDKGENFVDVKPKVYPDLETYLKHVPQDIGDNGYRYIFMGGVWHGWGEYEMPTTPTPLPQLLVKMNEGGTNA